jgi:hypothetical protein
MPHVIVEYEFDSPISDEEIDRLAEQLDPCLEGYGVKWVQSFLALDRRRRLCIYEAADAEAVRSAYRSARVGFLRAWAAEEITDDADGLP